MKKDWNKPEINGVGVSITEASDGICYYQTFAMYTGTTRYACLGVRESGNFDNVIQACDKVFESYNDWDSHFRASHSEYVNGGEYIYGAQTVIS